jgi:hypothetical protein
VPISLDPSQTITDFASATPGPGVEFTADGFGYEVVPEVSFYGLFLGAVSLDGRSPNAADNRIPIMVYRRPCDVLP